jgi:hypothetical protein
VINRPKAKQKAKTERIAFAPIDLPVFRQADYVLREPHRRNPYWLHYQSNWRDRFGASNFVDRQTGKLLGYKDQQAAANRLTKSDPSPCPAR